ncbi:flavodoxin domain-containing protein [Pseudactinotalea suaedae]|uniref:flavodoxin domain-containing protein n=1 Tax=Pseudactinotalea suaedae TaxID=1524924 RepID=UPI0012E1AADB|nr:flavodoxin domain-containing protein [Pseudactinotalea suaedae]
MRVLVITASKHGSTRQVGEVIAARIGAGGHDVLTRDAELVGEADLVLAEAVVLGSAIYGARPLSSATALATRLAEEVTGPVWLFAVGLKSVTRDPLRPAATRPNHGGFRSGAVPVFGGVVDDAGLSRAERALIGALGASGRDARDLELVGAWADAVALQVTAAAQGSSSTLPVV